MRELTLHDDTVVKLRRVASTQLSAEAGTLFDASPERPLLLTVVEVDGKPILQSHLVVIDPVSIDLANQAEVLPGIGGASAVATGLSYAQAIFARELFVSLVSASNWAALASDRNLQTRESVWDLARKIEDLSRPSTEEDTFFPKS